MQPAVWCAFDIYRYDVYPFAGNVTDFVWEDKERERYFLTTEDTDTEGTEMCYHSGSFAPFVPFVVLIGPDPSTEDISNELRHRTFLMWFGKGAPRQLTLLWGYRIMGGS